MSDSSYTSYQWIVGPYTYDQALSGATAFTLSGITGHLLTFESASESTTVTAWLHANYDTFPSYYASWLAISDAATEGTWLYTAGPLSGLPITFANWLPGEPNNIGDEDYVDFNFNDPLTVAHLSGRWTDRGATNLYASNGYVVEFDGLGSDPGVLANTFTVLNDSVSTPTDTDVGTNSIAESSANGTTVGITASALDFTGHALTYFLADNAGGRFSINSSTGVVNVANGSLIDYEAANSYNITVAASDGTLTNSQTFTILVTNVNEAPILTSGATGSQFENVATSNVVYTVAATDDGGITNTLIYALSGTDSALFNINSATGAVTFKTSPNFEAPADESGDNQYQVIVHANDGTFDIARAVTISVTDVNAAPVLTSGTTGGESENAAILNVVYTVTATDDGENNGTRTYALSGTDSSLFNIDNATGAVTFKVSPNYETPADENSDNQYQVIVHANDGTLDSAQAVTISVTNVVGVTIGGTSRNDLIDATHTVRGQPLPTDEEDTINGGGGNDTINGLGGNDTINGGVGKDTLYGDSGNDLLKGGEDNDRLFGGVGDDTLNGGDGNDTLEGGVGRDIISGGRGADSFVFRQGDFSESPAFDVISDFSHAQKDKIDLSGIDAINGGVDNAFSFIGPGAFTHIAGQLRYVVNPGGGVTVEGDTDGNGSADFHLVVAGVASLTTTDFIL